MGLGGGRKRSNKKLQSLPPHSGALTPRLGGRGSEESWKLFIFAGRKEPPLTPSISLSLSFPYSFTFPTPRTRSKKLGGKGEKKLPLCPRSSSCNPPPQTPRTEDVIYCQLKNSYIQYTIAFVRLQILIHTAINKVFFHYTTLYSGCGDPKVYVN